MAPLPRFGGAFNFQQELSAPGHDHASLSFVVLNLLDPELTSIAPSPHHPIAEHDQDACNDVDVAPTREAL